MLYSQATSLSTPRDVQLPESSRRPSQGRGREQGSTGRRAPREEAAATSLGLGGRVRPWASLRMMNWRAKVLTTNSHQSHLSQYAKIRELRCVNRLNVRKREWEMLQGMVTRGLARSYSGTWTNTEIFVEIGHSEQMEGQASEKSTYFMLFPSPNSQLES